MTSFTPAVFLLAAETGGPPPAAGSPAPTSGFQGLWGFLPFIAIFVAFLWFTSRSQKKRERKRQEMLDGIKVKDDVMTIGGIRGRVVQVTDDELVLRIDPEKDVKVTIARSGVNRKVGDEAPG